MTVASLLVLVLLGTASAPPQDSALVEPEQLTKNPDLVDREITVDDRVRYFQSHRGPGGKQIYDELMLKRTDVVFRLPPALRPDRPPRETGARVQGILRREGRALYCEVQALEMLPADADRLEREIARLSTRDSAGRRKWADWAAARGRAFKDEALTQRAKVIEIEALMVDAEKVGVDLLALAREARKKELGDAVVGGFARKALLERFAAAKTSADHEALAKLVREFYPSAGTPKTARDVDVEHWTRRIGISPFDGYRQAPGDVRAFLERKLLADVLQKQFERRAEEEPARTMAIAEEARAALPDRPAVSGELRDRALNASESNVGAMRLSEVEQLAKTFKDDGQADRATRLFQTWLGLQRAKKLSAGDSEGRVLLASQYERLLNDRATAAVLLHEAVRIDPNSKEAADAFRRLGYKKGVDGQWIDGRSTPPSSTPVAGEPAPAPKSTGEDSLRGLTPREVLAKFGSKPERIVYSATQDATIEQWIYQRAKGVQVVNFRRSRNGGRTVVISSYALPN